MQDYKLLRAIAGLGAGSAALGGIAIFGVLVLALEPALSGLILCALGGAAGGLALKAAFELVHLITETLLPK